MTKKDIIALSKSLNNILSSEKESKLKFKYGIIKMNKAIEGEIATLSKLEDEITKILVPFEQERATIFEKYGYKENDVLKLKEENLAVANEEFKTIIEKHTDIISESDLRWKEYIKLLDDTVDITLNKINISIFPDWIEPKDLIVFTDLNLIDESEE